MRDVSPIVECRERRRSFAGTQAPSLRARGYSWREIAGRLGTSVASVRRACQTPNVSSLGVAKTPKTHFGALLVTLLPCWESGAQKDVRSRRTMPPLPGCLSDI